MSDTNTLQLPESGLAEDILAQFLVQAQQEEDVKGTEAVKTEGMAQFHLVTFSLGREEYGVEIASVQEIIRATGITPVPGAPRHVSGVINVRGKILPVIDLRKRFGLAEADADEAQRIIVVEMGAKRLGMLVDSVSQVLKFSSAIVEDIPEEAMSLDDNYIKGIGKLDNRLIIIIDLKQSLL